MIVRSAPVSNRKVAAAPLIRIVTIGTFPIGVTASSARRPGRQSWAAAPAVPVAFAAIPSKRAQTARTNLVTALGLRCALASLPASL